MRVRHRPICTRSPPFAARRTATTIAGAVIAFRCRLSLEAVDAMVARHTKIGIEATPPAIVADAEARADEAVLRLARLIGRQMAREEVARPRAAERRVERKRESQ